MTTAVSGKVAVQLPALDTMRAVGAVAVLATHTAFWSGAYARSGWGFALARLDFGVAIFFVLSGFLLARPWLARHADRQPAPSVRTYFWRRLLRIVPVYLIAGTTALLVLPGNADAGPRRWLTTLTLTNTYLDEQLPDGLTQMWSLGTEAAFYLTLPGIMWMALSRRHGNTASGDLLLPTLVALGVFNALWLLVIVPRLDGSIGLPALWLPSYLSWFSVGILLAACQIRLGRPEVDDVIGRLAPFVARMGLSPGACWTAGLAVFALAATPLAGPVSLTPPTLTEALVKNLLYAVAAGLLILPCVFASPGGTFIRVMSLRPLRHLGHISYGIFCVHLVVLELVVRYRDMTLFEGRSVELFALTLVFSVLVSEGLYRVVELPVMRLKNLPGWARRTSPANSNPRVTATKS